MKIQIGPAAHGRPRRDGCGNRSSPLSVSPNPEQIGASMRPVSRRIKGVPPGARKATREVARQCGASLGAWLASLRTTNKDIQRHDEEQIACIGRQIHELKCQIDILSRDGSTRQASGDSQDIRAGHLSQAIARKRQVCEQRYIYVNNDTSYGFFLPLVVRMTSYSG